MNPNTADNKSPKALKKRDKINITGRKTKSKIPNGQQMDKRIKNRRIAIRIFIGDVLTKIKAISFPNY